MVRSKKQVYEAEASRFYNDGVYAEMSGDTKEAEHCYKMTEEYLTMAKIKYTGKGNRLSWSI